ncbi:pyridoxal phosphate-dependent aminotransferase [Catalinimonas niigatensis]|uniref:pyridoxal phosphate-dependent aminotransferase n=1 Tax=Catalinimonas niigatensis TaxID=1397264 RepID=UPI002664FA4B|nr:pyridoxal phosphate-dependent aminotransferase [Catalinimonas niigatensis]WPP47958.1 pyridoxal phosphate-dependent aminotransferase [Catalinimonas niigatensis]
MEQLSDRIKAMEESATIAMAQKARELKTKGIDVISLSLGEPDFKTPEHICQAAKDAIDEGKYFTYSPVPGYLDLRQAIAEKLKKENQLSYTAEQIVVSTGAKQSIANAFMCLLNPGDEVIVYAPYWVSYAEIIKLAEGVPVLINGTIENNFKATADQLKKAITPKTKAVIFSSPCNPTGAVFSREELGAMAEALADRPDIVVIADEIYEHINFSGEHVSIASMPGMMERTVTVNGFSKGFAMTGWRLGYIAAPLEIAKACGKIQGQFTSGTNSIAQRAALAALKGDMKPTEEMGKAYHRRRDLVLEKLKEVPGIKTYVPNGAFYIFPDVSSYFGKSDGEVTIKDSEDFCMYILNTAHVSLVTGDAFGAPECVRLSYAASDEDLVKAIHRIKEALSKLK